MLYTENQQQPSAGINGVNGTARCNGTSQSDKSSSPSPPSSAATMCSGNNVSICCIPPEQRRHIWIVTGPAGCGKTTVCKGLNRDLGLPFLEGDDFHSQSNKEKMGSGTPLTDADRWDWLVSLRDAALQTLTPSEENNFNPPSGVIMSCSALKRKYRDVLRIAAYHMPSARVHFIYLRSEESVLVGRLTKRKSHYMSSNMVHSQLEALEDPSQEKDVTTIDVNVPPDEVQQRVMDGINRILAEEGSRQDH
ncbi:hypothetical protein VTN31DRAFT_6060 [Thermomyces dupontii]|uniref:uncharacterized protein n=1 Tax=Talaromyces thermophilus TaxID=28565 RepID=UPI003742FC9D